MEFGEVCEVIPWDILALDCKQTLEDEQVCNPRVFKSHESYPDIAKGDGVKYIYVARNPLDAFVSFHKFMYVGLLAFQEERRLSKKTNDTLQCSFKKS